MSSIVVKLCLVFRYICTYLHDCTGGKYNIKSWTSIGWLKLEKKKKKNHKHEDFILCLYLFNIDDTTTPSVFFVFFWKHTTVQHSFLCRHEYLGCKLKFNKQNIVSTNQVISFFNNKKKNTYKESHTNRCDIKCTMV